MTPERKAAYDRARYLANRDERRAQSLAYYHAHREERCAYAQDYYYLNKDERIACTRRAQIRKKLNLPKDFIGPTQPLESVIFTMLDPSEFGDVLSGGIRM
jgi:hypothetical protein